MPHDSTLENRASGMDFPRYFSPAQFDCTIQTTRSRRIEQICDESDEFIEFVVEQSGTLLYMSRSLVKRLNYRAKRRKNITLEDVIGSAGLEIVLGDPDMLFRSRVIHFIDSDGYPFSARVKAISEPGRLRIIGLLTISSDSKEQIELHSLNNQLAVTSRELTRQRMQLEALVAEARSKEAELLAAYQSVERVSRTDPLTGLGNRRLLDDELPLILEQASLAKRPVSVLLIDLDRFKQINDEFGHEAGDQVLGEVAAVLRRNTRGNDLAVRMGGEELMLVLPGVGCERAIALAENLRQGIVGVTVSASERRVTASIGIATWLAPEEPMAVLLARADTAMYRAKAEGRNRCVVAVPPMCSDITGCTLSKALKTTA